MKKKEQTYVLEIDGGDYVEVFDPKKYEFEKEYGYVHKGYVYIYKGKVKNNQPLEPGSVYLNEKGDPVWVDHSEETREDFNIKKLIPLSNDKIYEDIMESANFKDVDPILLEQSDDFFAPKINESDDVLKVLIKKVLQEKKVNIKAAKSEINSYDITNMKSALTKPNKMSFKYFTKWCETLEIDCHINVAFYDSEGNFMNFTEKI